MLEDVMTWSNQVAVVTGRSARHRPSDRASFPQRGRRCVCKLYAARAEAAEQVASEIVTGGGRAMTASADVADFAAVQAMIERAGA
jgi:NAD(P)-dependent dehydrogenase (short-subunit alcohol dehydrogenase family)